MSVDRYTILHRKDEHGVIAESKVFGPDDEVPEGFGAVEFEVLVAEARSVTVAESKLTPWESPVDVSWVAESEPDGVIDEIEDESDDDDEDEDDLQPPPKGGAGSGVEAWAAYADAKGVEVPEGATRDDIIAACEAADVPVD